MGTFLSDIVLQVLYFVKENERSNIRQRQAEEIAAAKARGVLFGRPQKPLAKDFLLIKQQWEQWQITLREAVYRSGVSKSTFCRRLKKLRNSGKIDPK